MAHKRAHVILPDDLLSEIDALVGQRQRSAFLVEVLRQEVNRRRLLQVLNSEEPIWKDEDHPELAQGAEAGFARCVSRISVGSKKDWVIGSRVVDAISDHLPS